MKICSTITVGNNGERGCPEVWVEQKLGSRFLKLSLPQKDSESSTVWELDREQVLEFLVRTEPLASQVVAYDWTKTKAHP